MHFYYYYCAPLFLLLLLVTPAKAFVRQQQLSPICSAVVSSLAAAGGMNARELEIRKKIAALRKEGKLTKTPSDNALINDNKANTKNLKGDYEAKIRNKLGNKRSKLLGYGSTSDYGGTQETTLDSVDQEMLEQDLVESQEEAIGSAVGSTLRLGGLTSESALFEASEASSVQQNPARKPIINPDLFDNAEDEEEEMNEVDMIKLVEKGLAQKKALELELEEAKRKERALEQLRQPPVFAKQNGGQQPTMTTTGIGGSYTANETARSDMYQPKVGSWGAFPRPRDISKAYGGGRLVAPGYYSEAERQASDERTRARLKEYLVSAGIDVQSEKDHASEINEALAIGARAMERGLYNTAVSALEKVTKYCSSNSPVGGKVYLELAMAYDSAGQKEQAILVYKTLTKSRTDKIKTDAKRLLYGIEAIRFMQDDIKSKEFSRQAAVSPFIDLMQIDLFNDNFDNKYYVSCVLSIFFHAT
jgi:5-hydroxyisourate hydrolase-like protein (transthyretin family)